MTEPSSTLRDAATRLREVAEAATPGPWWAKGAWFDSDDQPMPMVGHGRTGADWIARTARRDATDAAYIALVDPVVGARLADWLDDIATRHAPDPDPVELVLHYDEPCPTGECEDPGYHEGCIVCSGCYPQWDGMDGHSLYPCAETKAALSLARSILGEEA